MSVEAFNSAVGSLERQLLPGARKFGELGINADRQIEVVEPVERLVRPVAEPAPGAETAEGGGGDAS
jgi:DNA recombination protein RmuC